jgi:hypothetical protein
MGIAAADVALWDLKARVLGLPLCSVFGMARDRVPIYGSGGFTAYSSQRLVEQLGGWVDDSSGQVIGVHYMRGGNARFQRAAAVAVAGYSIETPRLLLNSVSRRFPHGLANGNDQVGRYVMVQGRLARVQARLQPLVHARDPVRAAPDGGQPSYGRHRRHRPERGPGGSDGLLAMRERPQ